MEKTPHRNAQRVILALAVALSTQLNFAESAEPRRHATTDEIRIGMSTALSGPASELGKDVRTGVLAAFEEANRGGGINNRRVKLLVLDDGYEPSRTAPNMRQLIEADNVSAVIGNVGTPTAIASIPIINSTGTPFFGAFTGASVLRKDPPDRYVINFRASYAEETAAMVKALVEIAGLAPKEIAFFTQRDGYGDAGFSGGLEALHAYGITDSRTVAHGRYERNTELIERGLAEILLHRTPPKAIIMVGAYAPCAKFIRKYREINFATLFLNVSFVGANSLARALGSDGEGVVITQVVPHPESDSDLAVAYRSAMRDLNPDYALSHGSFEGYISAEILKKALSTINERPDRESIVQALERLGRFQLGPLSLELSEHQHQASHAIWPTRLVGGRVLSMNWDELIAPNHKGPQ